jgi:hypothetical protein
VCANAEVELKEEGQALLKYFETKSASPLAFISRNSCSSKQALLQITDFRGEAVYLFFS